ncbi:MULTISPECIES: DUF2294 domain-containing protein [Paenibacillus]|uniref:DUF2294 domain-containing protein n=1 Tax=Paenibacillus TaxID=44249 RepID=UPI000368A341|nr:DUF2294 domain-containing protein [Paenibacillus massiliensis]
MKKEAAFNEIVRKVRKDTFGKGPERIHTTFVENMAITKMYGNFTPTEKFIAKTTEGVQMVHSARTHMIKKLYENHVPDGMEELCGSRLIHLFSDIKVDEDVAVSVFLFEKNIEQG